MNLLKAIRIAVVFGVSGVVTFFASVNFMLWVFVSRVPHDGKYDDGNGGVLYYFLGVFVGLVAAPTVGGLAALGVESAIKHLARKRTAAG